MVTGLALSELLTWEPRDIETAFEYLEQQAERRKRGR